MILRDLTIYGQDLSQEILIRDGQIAAISNQVLSTDELSNSPSLSLKGATVFPGFINSHDHLDFNLYPRLGQGPYQDYTQWGQHIHQAFATEIAAVQKIPLSLRIEWGVYKNLLNGFTTVVEHGTPKTSTSGLIGIFNECHSLHSLAFEKNWWLRLNHPFHRKKPYVIHCGEGTGAAAAAEIGRLIRGNLFRKKLIAIHGVAMEPGEAHSFKALVWCPSSNYFLFGQTARIAALLPHCPVVFGTDSTLTSSWHVQDHLLDAMKEGMVGADQLYQLLGEQAADCWGLPQKGRIAAGKDADLIAFAGPQPAKDPLIAVIRMGELLVLQKELATTLIGFPVEKYTLIRLRGQSLWVKGRLDELVRQIQTHYPSANIPFQLL